MSLVSTNWVEKNIKNLKIIDCSWHMPSVERDGHKEYLESHIENAKFFDLDKNSDQKTNLPHMTPSKKTFQKSMRSFGVNDDSIIIIYDTLGIYSSPRVWWLFKYFGHEKTFILNGGLKKWLKEDKPITKKIFKHKIGNFKVKTNRFLKINYKIILKNLNKKNFIILDARNNNRFKGKINEPRPNLKSGHIPKSKNIFWGDLITNRGTI